MTARVVRLVFVKRHRTQLKIDVREREGCRLAEPAALARQKPKEHATRERDIKAPKHELLEPSRDGAPRVHSDRPLPAREPVRRTSRVPRSEAERLRSDQEGSLQNQTLTIKNNASRPKSH